jgi:hypothetical protein
MGSFSSIEIMRPLCSDRNEILHNKTESSRTSNQADFFFEVGIFLFAERMHFFSTQNFFFHLKISHAFLPFAAL